MKSPFPGMDPYLEEFCRDVHARLIIYSCDQLQDQLPGDLYARVEERVVLEFGEPVHEARHRGLRVVEYPHGGSAGASAEAGVAVAEPVRIHCTSEPMTETYIEIIDAATGQRVVTVIEFLSLTNKYPGDGQDQFRRKQAELRQARVSLAEIDLLRGGKRALSVPMAKTPRCDYARHTRCACTAAGNRSTTRFTACRSARGCRSFEFLCVRPTRTPAWTCKP